MTVSPSVQAKVCVPPTAGAMEKAPSAEAVFIASLKVTWISASTGTSVAPLAGTVLVTAGVLDTVTVSPVQLAGISFSSKSLSEPSVRLIWLLSPGEPRTWKCSTASVPEPLTLPIRKLTTRNVPDSISFDETGMAVEPIWPSVISSSRSTAVSKEISYEALFKSITSLMSTVAVKSSPDSASSGALMVTVTSPLAIAGIGMLSPNNTVRTIVVHRTFIIFFMAVLLNRRLPGTIRQTRSLSRLCPVRQLNMNNCPVKISPPVIIPKRQF